MNRETNHSIAAILARQPLFRDLDAVEIAPLAEGTREYRVNRNELLFQKGDPVEGLYLVLMGQIKLAIPSLQGNEKVIHMAGPGATFGEAALFLGKPYPLNAQATQDSLILLTHKQALFDALANNASLSRKMLAGLSMRLHELIEDVESCTLRTSMERVVCFLTHHQPSVPVAPGHFTIQLDTSKQTIASQLNLAPETFSRVLGHLSEAGLIRVKGRNITVLDRDRLRTFQS